MFELLLLAAMLSEIEMARKMGCREGETEKAEGKWR
jgi:hypothetical protein